MRTIIIVDCEGAAPGGANLVEFGAVPVAYRGKHTHARVVPSWFHGKATSYGWVHLGTTVHGAQGCTTARVWQEFATWLQLVAPAGAVFVSDNPAYDWQAVNYGLHTYTGGNPFGHSARRIGDYYAGLVGDWHTPQDWKQLRVTPHTHNPVEDARGNAEALARLLNGERP